MDKLELDYRNCEQPPEHLHNLTPKLLTPVAPNFLHFNDELKNQSPILFKESATNPFAETFKQAALHPFNSSRQVNFDDRNPEVDNNESLNTPSIDLKHLEPRKFVNRPLQCNGSKGLDLLISASSNDRLLNSFNNQNNNQHNEPISSIEISEDYDDQHDRNLKIHESTIRPQAKRTKRANKRILPKSEADSDDVLAYKVWLKLPDGSSVSIPTAVTTTVIPSHSPQPTYTSSQFSDDLSCSSQQQTHESPSSPFMNSVQPQANQTKSAKASSGRRNSRTTNSRKRSQPTEKIETTTLKSIKTALSESPTSQLNYSTTDLVKCDSIHSYSQSSQSSTTSSLYNQFSMKDQLNDPDLPLSSASSSQSSTVTTNSKATNSSANNKSKPGRRAKSQQAKEDPSEKKIRSLERNREAASRCRTKRKIWVSALDQKADDLEKQNKELHAVYNNLLREVQLLKSALLNNKTTSVSETISTSTLIDSATTSSSKPQSSSVDQLQQNVPTQRSETTMPSNSNLFDVLLQAAKKTQTNQDLD